VNQSGAVAAILLALALPSHPQQDRGVLLRAEIAIGFEAGDATVHATYTVAGAASLDLLLLRLMGQDVDLHRATVSGRPAAAGSEATALRLTATALPETTVVEVDYRVSGGLDRIPVFVPSVPTRPPSGAVRILVTGYDPTRLAALAMPRFTRAPDGTLIASLEHVPSLVAVLAEDGAIPVPWIAEVAVLVIALGGTGFWVARLARGRRRTREAA